MKTRKSSAPAVGGDTDAATARAAGGADAAATTGSGAAGASASAAPVDGAPVVQTDGAETIDHQDTREGASGLAHEPVGGGIGAGGAGGGPALSSSADTAGLDPALPTAKTDVAAAASVTLLDGRPEDVARAARAAAGSALDAPSVGSGPTAEMPARADAALRPLPAVAQGGALLGGVSRTVGTGAGIPPGVFSREGSFGAEPELSRFGEDVPQIRRAFLEGDLRRALFTGAKLAFPKPDNAQALADYAEAGFDIEITSRQRGFRRAGVVHPTEPTIRRSGDFSATELQALVSEPMLTVLALRGPLAGDD